MVGTKGTVRRSWIAGGTWRWIRRLHHQREKCRQGRAGQGSGASSVGRLSGPEDAPEISRTAPRPAGVMPWEWLAGGVTASSPLPSCATVAEIVLWTETWERPGLEMLYQSMGGCFGQAGCARGRSGRGLGRWLSATSTGTTTRALTTLHACPVGLGGLIDGLCLDRTGSVGTCEGRRRASIIVYWAGLYVHAQ